MNELMYQEFEAYLEGEMSAEQQADFELKIGQNPDVQLLFEQYQFAYKSLQHKYDPQTSAFKSNLNQISKEHFGTTAKKRKVFKLTNWYVSAAASVVLALGLWYYFQSETPQYSDFDIHEQAAFVERSSADQNLKDAQQEFNAKKYASAVVSFQKLPMELMSSDVMYFYAISLLETNDFAKAELLFNKLDANDSLYKDKAIWYLALSQLKQHHLEACKKYLQQISPEADEFYKAQELLGDLE